MFKDLSDHQLERYSRQLLLPQWSGSFQKRLMNSRVLIIGAGGLGSSLVMHLAGVGVGCLGVMDDDRIELSNLHRQGLYGVQDIDQLKVEKLADYVAKVNPDVEMVAYTKRLSCENTSHPLSDYDVIVDGSDNFSTRFYLNEQCYYLKKPLVSGAVIGFQGRVFSFKSYESGPCYECFHPHDQGDDQVGGSCEDQGVMGPVVGIVAAYQALEVIKIIVGMKHLLGQILIIDGLMHASRYVKLNPDPMCCVCGRGMENKI